MRDATAHDYDHLAATIEAAMDARKQGYPNLSHGCSAPGAPGWHPHVTLIVDGDRQLLLEPDEDAALLDLLDQLGFGDQLVIPADRLRDCLVQAGICDATGTLLTTEEDPLAPELRPENEYDLWRRPHPETPEVRHCFVIRA